jgi:hypothetical protein
MENIEYKGYTIKVDYDESADNPRQWDNVGQMLCFHKRYKLGDKTDLTSDSFNGWQEVYDYLKDELKAVVILPLYLYEHSGLCLKVGSFIGLLPQGHAEFDSGQVGYIYVTAEKLKAEGMTKKKAEAYIRGEVDTYNKFLNGEVYWYRIEKEGKDFDSCGGYYDYDDMIQEAKSNIDGYVKAEKTLQLQY